MHKRWFILGIAWIVLVYAWLPAAMAQTNPHPKAVSAGKQLLKSNWEAYKYRFIQADGRVIDYNANISTSEGQSYAMLRAVWMRDKDTFDRTYKWAKDNLQIPRGDHLFSWKWGERADHSWGPLDQISASDADQDIALALLMAAEIWQNPAYKDEALLILGDLWDKLTINTPLGRVLLPGDWPELRQVRHKTYQINPSYFAPYAYRVFAQEDPDHDWQELVDTSYEIIERAMGQTTTHLPPDWVEISQDGDAVKLYTEPADPRSDYGYEAIRVYWRVALDAMLNPADKRPARIMAMPNLLPRYWKIRQDVPISFTWDGIPRKEGLESGAAYGASLPSFYQQDRAVAEQVVLRKILPSLRPGGPWNTDKDYYSQNWLWFGLALHEAYGENTVFSGRTPQLKNLMKLMLLDGVAY